MDYYIKRIRDILQAGLSKKVKYYYIGDPMVVPQEILVAGVITVYPVSNSIEVADTQRDKEVAKIRIQVMKDLKQDYNKRPQEVVSNGWIMEIIEGRDDNGILKSDTIRYILRDNVTQIGIVSDLEIEYLTEQRDEQQVRVGTLTFTLTDLTTR